MSDRRERAREYSRKRWELYRKLGQLAFCRKVLQALTRADCYKTLCSSADLFIASIVSGITNDLEALNAKQKRELEGEGALRTPQGNGHRSAH